MEDHDVPNGWPLGLENMNLRLRTAENALFAAAEAYNLHIPSSSFSSFSSSNLDTESSASFFQDHSVSLGRLIGIRPGDRGRLYFPNAIPSDQHESNMFGIRSQLEVSQDYGDGVYEMSPKLCVPLLLNVVAKISRSKSSCSRH